MSLNMSEWSFAEALPITLVAAAGATNGIILDLAALNAIANRELAFVYDIDWTAGTMTFTVQTDDNVGFASPTAVAGVTSGALGADTVGRLLFSTRERYVRIVATGAGAPCTINIVAVLIFPTRYV